MTHAEPNELRHLFDALMASAHLPIAAEEYEQALRNYAQIRRETAELRFGAMAAFEPATIHRVAPWLSLPGVTDRLAASPTGYPPTPN